MKIEELSINKKEKQLLLESIEPKTISQLAARIGARYNSTSTLLMVLCERKFLQKIKKGKQTFYYLNQDEVEL
jgi:predicted transcriptional regulator